VNEKTCTKCGETFPRTKEFFQADKNRKHGLKNWCKQCAKEYHKEYYQNNREHIKEYNKEYYQNNREHIKEYNKEYRQNNKEHIKEYNKEYHQNNREHIKEYNKEYHQNNREHIKKYKKNQPAGVYKITNTKTGTIYIGQSTAYPHRWNCHKSHLRHNRHEIPQLQEDYDTYGEEAFIFEVIEQFPCNTSSDVLLEKEEEQIKKHLREGKGLYNTHKLGG